MYVYIYDILFLISMYDYVCTYVYIYICTVHVYIYISSSTACVINTENNRPFGDDPRNLVPQGPSFTRWTCRDTSGRQEFLKDLTSLIN